MYLAYCREIFDEINNDIYSFQVKDDQIFVDERQIIWGNTNLETTIPILPRGLHKFPFK